MERARRTAWSSPIVVGALLFVLGAQSLRVLLGTPIRYLRGTLESGAAEIALLPFVLALLFPLFARWTGTRSMLTLTVVILGVTRVTSQIVYDPVVDIWLSTIGTAAFVGSLPLLHAMGRSVLIGTVLLGITIDSAIRGAFLSVDLAFQRGLAALVGVLAIALAALALTRTSPTPDRHGGSWRRGWTLTSIGPFFFLQWLLFQNQGWWSEVSGMSGRASQLTITALNVVSLFIATKWGHRRVAYMASLAVLAGAVLAAEQSGLLTTALFFVAVPAAALVWAGMVPDPGEETMTPSSVYLALGMSGFVALVFLYYVPLNTFIELSPTGVRLGALLVFSLFVLVGIRVWSPNGFRLGQPGWVLTGAILVLPVVGYVANGFPAGEVVAGSPVSFMTYNINTAYDSAGRHTLNAVVEVMRSSEVAVAGLQEVSRGSPTSGLIDMFAVLQARLGYEHGAFSGATDPTRGNAILSRYPIVEVAGDQLPRVGAGRHRGYVVATIDIDGSDWLVISTHLQNRGAGRQPGPEADLDPVHREQIGHLLEVWGGHQPAVLMGDFNARPGEPQIEELIGSGWQDTWAVAGVGEGHTARYPNPSQRVDFIFATTDLEILEVTTIDQEASDHRPVVAVLDH